MEIQSASGQEAVGESLQRYCSTEGTPPLLLFPEEETTNGRAGLLKFRWTFLLHVWFMAPKEDCYYLWVGLSWCKVLKRMEITLRKRNIFPSNSTLSVLFIVIMINCNEIGPTDLGPIGICRWRRGFGFRLVTFDHSSFVEMEINYFGGCLPSRVRWV